MSAKFTLNNSFSQNLAKFDCTKVKTSKSRNCLLERIFFCRIKRPLHHLCLLERQKKEFRTVFFFVLQCLSFSGTKFLFRVNEDIEKYVTEVNKKRTPCETALIIREICFKFTRLLLTARLPLTI